jgi:hypothetical protein
MGETMSSQWGQQSAPGASPRPERPKVAPASPPPASGGRPGVDSDKIAELSMRLKAAEADLVTLDARCKRQGEQIEVLARQIADLAARARLAY